jgi:hypothetical protein
LRRLAAIEFETHLIGLPVVYEAGPCGFTIFRHLTRLGEDCGLVAEAAWAYRSIPRIGRVMQQRQEHLSAPVRALAWKAQLRLCGRFRRLSARGKPRVVIATAIARELTGFVWAVTREVPAPAEISPAGGKRVLLHCLPPATPPPLDSGPDGYPPVSWLASR